MLKSLAFVLACFACPAAGEVPRVATDIPPVHSLVARIMDGAGAPDLILSPGADPHHHAMRPSEAAALEQADVVIWIGEPLTPWLADAIGSLASDARQIVLLDTEGTTILEARHDDHDHGPVDPHAWLDPKNAKVWLSVIAQALAEADPENAAHYLTNRDEALAETDRMESEMVAALARLTSRPFAVYHDALAYLEARFGIEAAFAIVDSEAESPAPRRIAALRETATEKDVSLLFAEPGWTDGLVATVFEGRDVTICEIDPLGAGHALGARHYWETLRTMSETMSQCGAN